MTTEKPREFVIHDHAEKFEVETVTTNMQWENGEKVRVIERSYATRLEEENKKLRDENEQVWNKWMNLSLLVKRMIRKKTIEQVQSLAQDGRHLIYNNILRDASRKALSGETKEK